MALLSIRLNMPKEVLDKYEQQGENLGKTLSARLVQCVDHVSEKPLYIDDRLRRRLERLFGKNFDRPEDVVHMMERYVTARIGEVDVQLAPQLLTRLKSRCFGKPFDQFLAELTVEELERHVGMR